MQRDDADPEVRQAEAQALMKALEQRRGEQSSPAHALLLRALEMKYGTNNEEK